jgi:hypothetical protein
MMSSQHHPNGSATTTIDHFSKLILFIQTYGKAQNHRRNLQTPAIAARQFCLPHAQGGQRLASRRTKFFKSTFFNMLKPNGTDEEDIQLTIDIAFAALPAL